MFQAVSNWTVPLRRGLALAGLTALVAGCTMRAETPATPGAPPPVAVVPAERRSLPLQATFTGRVEAVQRVDVRSRVGGALDAVLFREGAAVTAGTPLFQIDRRPYEIALRRAEAEVTIAQAQLGRAREEFARAERLAAADAVSTEEVERRRSEVAVLAGRLEAAHAAVADASLNLEWTSVRAPVSGTMGKAEVTRGNLVAGGSADGTRLAVLQSLDPIYVYFEVDPATAARARTSNRRLWRASVTPFEGGPSTEGPVDFIDHAVGVNSGTLKVRARLANPAGSLLPATVVRVSFLFGTAENVTVVPEIAIGSDQGGRYVLVAGANGVIESRAVTMGAKAGAWRAIDGDVNPGDQIALPGLPGLRPGMAVTPVVEVVR